MTPFLFIQHHSGEAEEMSRFSHHVSEQRMKCLGERIWRWCVTQSSFRLYKSEELAIHFLWLFSICNSECLALQCFSARRCPYIKGIYFAPWLPFIVSGTSITWTHTAEGPNMQAGDDGILNKYCNWATGPFFMCCVYLLRPDGRFTRASIQCFYLEVCVCVCEFVTCDEYRIKTGCHWLLGQIYGVACTLSGFSSDRVMDVSFTLLNWKGNSYSAVFPSALLASWKWWSGQQIMQQLKEGTWKRKQT